MGWFSTTESEDGVTEQGTKYHRSKRTVHNRKKGRRNKLLTRGLGAAALLGAAYAYRDPIKTRAQGTWDAYKNTTLGQLKDDAATAYAGLNDRAKNAYSRGKSALRKKLSGPVYGPENHPEFGPENQTGGGWWRPTESEYHTRSSGTKVKLHSRQSVRARRSRRNKWLKRGLGATAALTGAYFLHKNKDAISQGAHDAANAMRRAKYAVLDRNGPSNLMLRPDQGVAWHPGMEYPDKQGSPWRATHGPELPPAGWIDPDYGPQKKQWKLPHWK